MHDAATSTADLLRRINEGALAADELARRLGRAGYLQDATDLREISESLRAAADKGGEA